METLLNGLHDLELDRDAVVTLSRQLYDRLRSGILTGTIPSGRRLPSSRNLARQFSVSRNTISNVVEQLTREGYLAVERGRRPIVLPSMKQVLQRSERSGTHSLKRQWKISDWAERITNADWPFWRAAVRPLFPGLADPREFPYDLWARALRRAGRKAASVSGLTVNRSGLQVALLAHLIEHRGVRAQPRQIIVAPSAQAAIALVGQVILNKGDVAWVESPGYGGTQAALQLAGAQVRGIPLDEHGLSISRRHDVPRMICVTPSHQYPTGRLMSVGRRLELLAFAEEVGAVIVEDDYDSEFHYDGRPVAALQGLNDSQSVVYLGSFSKSMGGAVRCGYLVVPEHLVEVFELAQRHLGQVVAPSLQDAFASFIEEGDFAANIRCMTRLYRDRRDQLVSRLQEIEHSGLSIASPAGGMQLVASINGKTSDLHFVSRLAAEGVVARPLSRHHIGRTGARQGLFLGFAAWNEREIKAAVDVIGSVARSLNSKQ